MKSRGVNGLYCTVIALLICCLKSALYLGEGKKSYALTKHVKKNTYCLVWGFSNDLSNQGG